VGLIEHIIYPFRRPEPPARRRATGFFTDTTLCIGCKACEVACKQWNQLPADEFRWTGQSYDNTAALSATTWRHVAFIEQFDRRGHSDPLQSEAGSGDGLEATLREPVAGRWLMMSDVCKHCASAPCQIACPTGAIIQNEFSNIYIQNDICNGCGYCVAACPFGVITRSALDGHAHKCTLCYDRQRDEMTPACAKACPTGSIQFGPLDEMRESARRREAELRARGVADARLYGVAPSGSYSELGAMFLLLDEPSRYGLPDSPATPQRHVRGDFARAALGTLGWFGAIAAMLIVNAA
jgi:formate dehydrogenase iron-sulfur subunit